MVPPDIEEALAALDEEMGPHARVRLARPRKPRPTRSNRVRWARVAEWCFDHPGVAFTATVHKNAVGRLKARYPQLRVEGSAHRIHPDTGKQIATLFAVYEDPDA